MLTAKTQSQKLRAKSQRPRAAFLSHSRDLSNGDVLRRNASLSDTLQSIRGRGNWDPNGRPQTTEVQAVSGLPTSQLLVLAVDLPTPLPSDQASISHTRRGIVNRQILYIRLIMRAFCKPAKIYVR